jgi:hypothetical protein
MSQAILDPSVLVPLRRDGTGALRVGTSRVLLELVIEAFHDGETPESIADPRSRDDAQFSL